MSTRKAAENMGKDLRARLAKGLDLADALIEESGDEITFEERNGIRQAREGILTAITALNDRPAALTGLTPQPRPLVEVLLGDLTEEDEPGHGYWEAGDH